MVLSSLLPKMVTTVLLMVDLLTEVFIFCTCILFGIVQENDMQVIP